MGPRLWRVGSGNLDPALAAEIAGKETPAGTAAAVAGHNAAFDHRVRSRSFARASTAYIGGRAVPTGVPVRGVKVIVGPSDFAVAPTTGSPGAVQMLSMCVRNGVVIGAPTTGGNPGGADVYAWGGAAWAKINTTPASLPGIYAMWCLSTGTLIANTVSAGVANLWRSVDGGVTWTAAQTITSNATMRPPWNLCETAHGTIIVTEYPAVNDANTPVIWRSTDDGATWANVGTIACRHIHTAAYHVALERWILATEPRQMVNAVAVTNGGTGYADSFAVTFTGGGGTGAAGTATAAEGVIQSVEITNPGTNYSYAPTPVFTAGGGANATATVTMQDSVDYNIFVSDADGAAESWTGKTTKGVDAYIQPVQFTDYGHPTRLLACSDTYGSLCWVDVSDESFALRGSLVPTQFTLNVGNAYAFDLRRINGLWYLAQHDDTNVGGKRYNSILVSTDPADPDSWVIAHRFTGNEHGVYWPAGVDNDGRLWGVYTGNTGVYAGFTMTAPRTAVHAAAFLSPATTNLANTADLSSFETGVATWQKSGNGTIARVETDGLHGGACWQFTCPKGTTCGNVYSPAIDVTSVQGQPVSVTCWVKGSGVWLAYAIQTLPVEVYTVGTKYSVRLDPDRWVPITVSGLSIGATGTTLKFALEPVTSVVAAEGIDIKLDCLQVEAGVATPWQIGGDVRAASAQEFTRAMPASWTELLAIRPLAHKWAYGSSATGLYIRSWCNGRTAATLYYLPSDQKFHVQITDGVNTDTLSSTEQWFYEQSVMHVALSVDADGYVRAFMCNGGPMEQFSDGVDGVSDHAFPGLAGGDVMIRYGDASANSGMSAWLADASYLDEALTTAAAVATAITDSIG